MNLPAPHTELAEGPVWDNYTSAPVGVLYEAWNPDPPTSLQSYNRRKLWGPVWADNLDMFTNSAESFLLFYYWKLVSS